MLRRQVSPAAWSAAVALLVYVGPGPDAAGRLLASPTTYATSPDAALTAGAAALAWGILGWLLIGYLSVLGGRGAGAAARLSRRLSHVLLPRTLRRLLETATGVSLAVVTATPALAAPVPAASLPPAARTTVAVSAVGAPPAADPLPSLDRPATTSVQLAPVPSVPPPILAPPEPAVAPVPPDPALRGRSTTERLPRSTDEIVVHRGDCLWSVVSRALGPSASDVEVARAWPRWYAANRSVIGADPDLLLPGQRLRPPAPTP